MSERRSRRGSGPGRLALALLATALALLAGEGLIRALGRAPAVKALEVSSDAFAYQRSDNPILSFELKPGYRNPRADLFQSYESINAHGQRDVERTLDKPTGVRRIVLLGDSVVEGTGVGQEHTLSRELEALYPEGTTEVLNFGVSGYCTLAAIELLETKALAFDPDDVVLVFVENDFHNFNNEAFQLGSDTPRPRWAQRLFVASHAFRLAALRLNWFGFGAEQDPMRWNRDHVGDNNVVTGLRRLRELARREGFRPWIAVWPRFTSRDVLDLPPMPGDPETLVIERLAAMFGLPAFRLSRAFRDAAAAETHAAPNPRARFTIGDGMHPSVHGNRVAARALHAALSERPWRPDPLRDDPEAVAVAAGLGTAEPDYAKVYTRLGNLARESGRLDRAEAHYARALQEDPDSTEAHLNLARLRRAQGRDDDARRHLDAALRGDPRLSAAHHDLGRLLLDAGDLDGATRHLRLAVDADPDDAGYHTLLADALERQGRLDDAARHYRQAIALDPAEIVARNNLGRLLESQGNLEGAAAQYQAALQLAPAHADILNNLGIVRVRQGRRDEGLAAFRAALQADPQHRSARNNLERLTRR